jgi:hypothetical protein
VAPRRRTDEDAGLRAVRAWLSGEQLERAQLATAVRFSLEELAAVVPGPTTEVRVPPFAAVQCLPGPRHTRGTPPNVVETDPQTWLGLATGRLPWAETVRDGRVRASGQRADLSEVLPLTRLRDGGSLPSSP